MNDSWSVIFGNLMFVLRTLLSSPGHINDLGLTSVKHISIPIAISIAVE